MTGTVRRSPARVQTGGSAAPGALFLFRFGASIGLNRTYLVLESATTWSAYRNNQQKHWLKSLARLLHCNGLLSQGSAQCEGTLTSQGTIGENENMNTSKSLVAGIALAGAAAAVPAHANELTANASVTNNYIWRGLTQSTNEPAVQGGFDFGHDSGFYIGTWVSNVQYESDDAFSYEHDMYAGFAGSFGENWTYDVGYLYYNYDNQADFDFGEVYATIGFKDFSFTGYALTNTEADEGPNQDFDAFGTYYLSADYGFTVLNGLDVGLHVGYHDGDFSEAFNGVDGDYFDWNVSISRGGFGFMVTSTNADGDFANGPARDNDDVKFVVSYSVDFDLLND
jgi:uncharacterized protein (TIGR02001 family)